MDFASPLSPISLSHGSQALSFDLVFKSPPTRTLSPPQVLTHKKSQSTINERSAATAHASVQSRTLILCFDGTGNKFGQISNVVRFFRALEKDNPEKQLVYYQPGIGTYNKRQFITRSASAIASGLDEAIALHIDDHVKEGYQFLMQNYRKGDKICLFGFSRGAHTARVVAGMLYKVGILPPHNDQQLDFAFSIYQTTGDLGDELSKEFKKTFSSPVKVEFVGVWDTVSSVGIIPRNHPYTSVDYSVKTFRHALALDERRSRFRPNMWIEATIEHEQELDLDEVDWSSTRPNSMAERDEWTYQPPKRNFADVKEVWFAGCHADIGGGSHSNKERNSLSFIPLRWMIKQCFLTGTGILFDNDYLKFLAFDFHQLRKELQEMGIDEQSLISTPPLEMNGTRDTTLERVASSSSDLSSPAPSHLSLHSMFSPASSFFSPTPTVVSSPYFGAMEGLRNMLSSLVPEQYFQVAEAFQSKGKLDAVAQIFDQLALHWLWWPLEHIPVLITYQKEDGSWMRQRQRNLGRGRYIPFYEDGVQVHESVKERMNDHTYTPSAYNWSKLVELGMVKWVS